VVWFVTGAFYILINQNISYLKLTPSTISQIQKVVTQTKIVITLIIIIIMSANVEYNRANAGTGDKGTINSNDRIAATMYSLGTWFVSGIYV
jgi:hypothetical protein